MRASEFVLNENFKVVKVGNEFRLQGPDGKIGKETFTNRARAKQAADRALGKLAASTGPSQEVNKIDSQEVSKNKKGKVSAIKNLLGKYIGRPLWRIIKNLGRGAVPIGLAGAWAESYFSYVTGQYTIGGKPSPCDRKDWSPVHDPVVDVNLNNPNFTWTSTGGPFAGKRYSFTKQMSDNLYVAVPTFLTATATGSAIAASMSSILSLFPGIGWLVRFGIFLASTGAAYLVQHLLRRKKWWLRDFADEMSVRVMTAFTNESLIKGLCAMGSITESNVINESSSARLANLKKEFGRAMQATLRSLKQNDPNEFMRISNKIKRADDLNTGVDSPFIYDPDSPKKYSDAWKEREKEKEREKASKRS